MLQEMLQRKWVIYTLYTSSGSSLKGELNHALGRYFNKT